jgi:hypothetical protein
MDTAPSTARSGLPDGCITTMKNITSSKKNRKNRNKLQTIFRER